VVLYTAGLLCARTLFSVFIISFSAAAAVAAEKLFCAPGEMFNPGIVLFCTKLMHMCNNKKKF
jgi:hypothetical protein